MKTQNYDAGNGINIGAVVAKAIFTARAIGVNVIVTFNGARFCVTPDTTTQKAIDTYMEVKNKMVETEQQLNQKTR